MKHQSENVDTQKNISVSPLLYTQKVPKQDSLVPKQQLIITHFIPQLSLADTNYQKEKKWDTYHSKESIFINLSLASTSFKSFIFKNTIYFILQRLVQIYKNKAI